MFDMALWAQRFPANFKINITLRVQRFLNALKNMVETIQRLFWGKS
jgi:hypothetical protein